MHCWKGFRELWRKPAGREMVIQIIEWSVVEVHSNRNYQSLTMPILQKISTSLSDFINDLEKCCGEQNLSSKVITILRQLFLSSWKGGDSFKRECNFCCAVCSGLAIDSIWRNFAVFSWVGASLAEGWKTAWNKLEFCYRPREGKTLKTQWQMHFPWTVLLLHCNQSYARIAL